MPILSRDEWDCIGEEVTRGEYKNAPNSIIRMWMSQKRLQEDARSYSRSNRAPMSKQKNRKSSRKVAKDLTPGNSTLQESITENNEEARRLRKKIELRTRFYNYQ